MALSVSYISKYFYKDLTTDDGTKYEIHANWRDIPSNADDQETPYTGLLQEPFDDTAPEVTDIQTER